ncbi:uncharacterized protein [Aristolochia californica]|uniref:uncharacterized protein isoform X2 n=1 Tax=Aristolochia californica TaxID=171875 RepID=UPI0035DA421A
MERVRTGLLGTDTREEAMDSIRAFWEESVKEMGLSFLESQAKVQCEEGKGVEQIPDEHPHDDHMAMGGWNVKAMKHDGVAMDNDRTFPPSSADMDGGNLPPREVEAPIRDVNDTVGRSYANQDSRAVNQDATDTNGITRNHDPLSTHEFRKLQRALIESSKNLKLVVEDPLPEALDAAEKLLYNSTTVQEDATTHEQIQNQSSVDRNGAPIGETYGSTHGEISTSNQNDKNHNGTSWPGFMSRNPTAQTYEWDEDLGESPSDNSSRSKGVRLPSPSQRVISPLKMQDMKKFARRRRIKKWSTLEEETLRNAVLKHGKGNWKFILKNYSTVFEDRTEVDLKDKWRNMVR